MNNTNNKNNTTNKNAGNSAAAAKQNQVISALNFGTVEAYKAIRTNLNFAVPKKGCRKIMFTSGLSGEGKTTTSVNTAITIAQTGAKTVIIDCDLRKSRIHRMFGQLNQVGLSNILSGMCTIDEAIKPTNKANLSMITAGTIPPNPAELIGSPALEELLAELEKRFDYIIIDSTPVNVVADALPLSKLVDGVVFVVKFKSSTHPSTADALRALEFAGANVVGAVMNGIETVDTYKKNRYKYKYRYRYFRYYSNYSSYGNYGYGYGYGYHDGNASQNSKGLQ